MSESSAEINYNNKIIKSELYHLWKKSRIMYDMIKDDGDLQDWQKKNIQQARDLLDKALMYSEYDNMFPEIKDEEIDEPAKNNFLSNEDKRYPTPAAQESGDQFVTRCILDANMKRRYPVQGDRFSACMTLFNENKNNVSENLHNNPGEKFEDPMETKDPDLKDPVKPILP
tara:strand:+ start:328 stop:840 length:513 start_codon:yes stop_codon:yes gene_type:complete